MRRLLLLGGSLAVFGGAVLLAFSGRWPWPRIQEARPIVVTRAYVNGADTLRRGETIGDLFGRQGVVTLSVARLVDELGLDPRRLRAGLVFDVRRALDEAEPMLVTVRTGPGERLTMTRRAAGWDLERQEIRWRVETARVEGEISSSLYEALDAVVEDDLLESGERVRLAWDIADVFMWSVDFTRDMQPGDRFMVLLEREVSEEGEVRFGRVLAAGLDVGGKPLTAFRFDADGAEQFYDLEGNSLRRAFLRYPVSFRRISSNFSRARFHPVLRTTRRHNGTDYAADPGTPIMAAGNGTIARAGRLGGLGIAVEIRHMNGILTRYGHMRGLARGIRAGRRVDQGDVIGYVGQTGLANGPHLHYEFHVNGVARDPRRVKLDETGEPVPVALRDAYFAERDRLALLLGVRVPAVASAVSADGD